ncbi:kinase-like protein [Dendrothele bispora CBS 962.96]|uniref:non-specific serine/threonine protein kinase n=1 Tax=Dendrothele bispora (strain CBS 962.96) TaxID=1314807 RepID=A0A4S8L0Z7_DENBC|nr:kinase-like protein [Dendrothele bispora CBS 962.96]
MSVPFVDQYESIDVIGNGSFGIIRKVRRKVDGQIFARKELNFDKMSDRDKKQIVAEVNILKDLHHDHIVRYHDRYVDRDAGMLYILMEYCGGGDLSTIIKQAQRHGRPIPEDAIWNYFMQILLALQHCHHPNGHGRNGSTGSAGVVENDGKERRAQILHRDVKPDNVFLDENNKVKLGDFGLSKALPQTNFANTYVGTPYYMSPELMQEKAYDSKSDIWSLGCLIYELCALRPPFHEAKTHAELSILIRNGRIPPLPKGYSQSLGAVIKAMLNLNPAMRPSAAQLLQHERLELVFKVSETEKMLATVKAHKATIIARERDVASRENNLLEREQQIVTIVAQKDAEISSLQHTLGQHQQQYKYTQDDLQNAIRDAIARREEELRVLVHQREEEVASAITKREEEIIASVNKREAELNEAWATREQQIRAELEDKLQWVQDREQELEEKEQELEELRLELQEKENKLDEKTSKGRREPLEEVKNVLEPVVHPTPRAQAKPRSPSPFPTIGTPTSRPLFTPASAMKGVILTATGEALATPAPVDLTKLFVESPKVGLDFTKIFDFGSKKPVSEHDFVDSESSADEAESPPPSPSARKERKSGREWGNGSESERDSSTSGTEGSTSRSRKQSTTSSSAPPTRLRRPSIRGSGRRGSAAFPASISDSAGLAPSPTISSQPAQPIPKPLPHPHLHSNNAVPLPNVRNTISSISGSMRTMQRTRSAPAAEYDLGDEENLPSPFLKRVERNSALGSKSAGKRTSSGNLLRTVAAVNATVRRKNSISNGMGGTSENGTPGSGIRPSVASARKASEEARHLLMRQS